MDAGASFKRAAAALFPRRFSDSQEGGRRGATVEDDAVKQARKLNRSRGRGQTRHQKVHNENGFKGPFRQQPAIAETFFGETQLGKKGKYPIRAR